MRTDLQTGTDAGPKACRTEGSDVLPTLKRPKHTSWGFRGHVLTLCFILASLGASAESPCNLDSITAAQRSYILGTAISVLEACELEMRVKTDDHQCEMVGRAALVVAELHRIKFEALDINERSSRRTLGILIDRAADKGLERLKGLPETSERLRLQADLLAAKIRSDFRAKKYGKKMKAAAARALEMDPENAHAMVSQAKPFLFAETRHGGNLEETVRLLGEALALQPELESALLLRALAYERQGEAEASRKDLTTALTANPQCRPAREALFPR